MDPGQRLLFPLPVCGPHVTALGLLSLCPLSISTGGGTLKSGREYMNIRKEKKSTW